MEEDSTVLEDTSPSVNYKEVMLDFEARRFLSKPDLAMSLSEASHWLGGHNSWLTFVGISAIMVILLIPFIMFTLYKILWSEIPISKSELNIGKAFTNQQSN